MCELIIPYNLTPQTHTMSKLICPRCLGKAHVDEADIIRLKRENDWSPGPCAFCKATGEIDAEEMQDISVDDADLVYDDLALETPIELNNELTGQTDWAIKFIYGILSLCFLLILSFVYVYLTDLNPIIYLNVVAWYFLSLLLIIPAGLLAGNNQTYKYLFSFIISCITIYLIFGMQSSIFITTAVESMITDSSMWPPKVDFGDLFSTLIHPSEYEAKLSILMEADNLSLSFRGRGSSDMGSSFTNFIRIIECLGIIGLPLYSIQKSNDKS